LRLEQAVENVRREFDCEPETAIAAPMPEVPDGATLSGALKVAASAAPGSNILCMLPDTGERYLSTPLFADVSADMNDEELQISRSTPGAQLGS